MKKRAVVISAMLSMSLMLTSCGGTWDEIKGKFTGNDGSVVSESAINFDDINPADYVTVPEYKGIEVDCSVGQDEVEAEIESFLGENAKENKK